MTTATPKNPKTPPATQSRYGFSPAYPPATRERQAAVDEINARAAELDERESELQADREEILLAAMTTTLGDLISEAERMKVEKATLEADRGSLMWDRHAELPFHEVNYQAAIAAAEQAVESAIAKQILDYAKTESTNSRCHRASTWRRIPKVQEPCCGGKRRKSPPSWPQSARSTGRRRTWPFYAANSPSCRRLAIPPSRGGRLKRKYPISSSTFFRERHTMFALPKISPQAADEITAGQRQFKVRILRQSTGLAGAILTPTHLEIFSQLADAIPHAVCGTAPLHSITAKELPRVRELLHMLPQTAAIRQFLTRTANGPLVATDL